MHLSFKNIAIRLLQIITIALISVYFITMYKSASALKISFSYHNFWSVLASIGFISIGFCLLPIPTLVLLKSVGKSIGFVSSMRLFFFSEVGKYLPGKVWVVLGRVMLYSKMGVRREKAIFILVLELSLMILTAGIISGKIMVHYVTVEPLVLIVILCSIPIFLSVIAWKYHIASEKMRAYIKIFAVPAVTVFISFIVFWVVLGWAFQYLIFYFTQLNIGFLPSMQIFAASWAAGFLAFFMPLGLGVREVFMTELLVPLMGNDNAILIAIISRMWWTLIESIFIVLSSGKMFSEFIRTSALPEITK